MENKAILITGGHSGIGLELTKTLLNEGHRVGLIVRNEKRKNEVLKEFQSTANIHFFFADLSSQEAIQWVVESIKAAWDKIDVLFNNAGVLLKEKLLSEQGNEMHYEVNTLAPYLLTIGLQDLIMKSNNPVVVNTSTNGLQHRPLDVEQLVNPTKFNGLLGSYRLSKHALLLLMNEVAKEWPNVRILNVNPGPIRTKMTVGDSAGIPLLLRPLIKLISKEPAVGAKLLYDGAFGEQHKGKTGVYLQRNAVTPVGHVLSSEQKDTLLKGVRIASANA